MGNLFTAFRNKTPLVVTAGQQARGILPYRPYLFAERATEFPRPYVKWSAEPARAEDVPAAIAQAFLIASQHPRGPTFVSIPSDDWAHPASPPPIRRIATEFAPDPAAIARLAEALAQAVTPAIVVGPDVDRSGAVEPMVMLAEKAKASVWASPMSSRSSFPEKHPLFAGFLHAAPHAIANALSAADLIVVVGAPVFTFHVEGHCALFDTRPAVWQITDDPVEAATAALGESIIGTLPAALSALADCLPGSTRTVPPARRQAPVPAPAVPLPPAYVLDRLSANLPEGTIIVEEAPSHRPAIQQYLPRPGADSFYTMASGGLGYGLPASIGVAFARPDRPVVCLVGDGSSMYSIQAIWTAVQHRLPVKFIVMNNSGYGAMRSFNRVMGAEGAPGIDLPGLNFVALAEGLGCKAQSVAEPGELDAAFAGLFASDGPILLDIVVDPAIADLFRPA
jgi:benzoylformate decarboxylase